MTTRRLLVLCYFYPPLAGGGVHRVLGFTRHLPAHGWTCTVVCAGEEDYWVRDDSLVAPPGVEVVRVRGGSALSAWMAWRRRAGEPAEGRRPGAAFDRLRRLGDWWLLPDSYAPWAARARRAAEARLRHGDVDAILSTSPPDSVHLAAEPLARHRGLPWVADFRDPWVGLSFRVPPTAWHRARQTELRRRVLEGADVVIAASRTHADALRVPGSRIRRIEHLPNGYEPAVGDAPDPTPADDEVFRLVFTGTLSLMPDTELFLEALHDLLARRPEARRRLRATLAGPFDTGYEDRAVALGLRGIVSFPGPRPHAETRALQRRADLLLLWKPAGADYRTMVPGKLYEYLDAGRPLLAMLDPDEEAAELVRRAGGTIVPPGGAAPGASREALAAAIEERYLAWREGARPSSQRPAWLADHTRARLAGRLAGVLDQLVAERAR